MTRNLKFLNNGRGKNRFKIGDIIIIDKLDITINKYGWEKELRPWINKPVVVTWADADSVQIEGVSRAYIYNDDCKLVENPVKPIYKEGDSVYIRCGFSDNAAGLRWSSKMKELIGKNGIIKSIYTEERIEVLKAEIKMFTELNADIT